MARRNQMHMAGLSLAALAIATGMAAGARADIAVRFPSDATPGEEAAVVAAVEKAQGAKARAFRADGRTAPEPAAPAGSLEALERARKAYKGLELDAAKAALDEAEASCIAAGSCGACRDLLFDAHLLRGAIALTLERETEGAAEFVVAHAVQPGRVVDPRRFPPKIVNAFNRACAEADAGRAVAARVSSEPAGAGLRVNGAAAREGADVFVKSTRVFVEAKLVGYAPRCEAFDVSRDGGSAHVVRLSAIGDEALAGEAERFLSGRDLAVDAAAFVFLARLGIDRVLILAAAAAPNRFTARATHAKATVWTALPALVTAADAAAPAFSEALALAVGAKRETKPAAEDNPPRPPAGAGDDGLEDEDEDADADADLDQGVPPPEDGSGKGSSVLRSPWLWISVGIVVAVVTGVVIGTQVGD